MAEAMGHPRIGALVAARFQDLGMAGARIGDFDQHLAGLEGGNFDLCKDERLAGFDKQGGFGFHAVLCNLRASMAACTRSKMASAVMP